MDDSDKEITIDDLTPLDWAEIRSYARIYYSKGDFEGNQLKCTVKAFVKYLSKSEASLIIEEDKYVSHGLIH